MANNILLIIWISILGQFQVLGYYCDSGRCSIDQYCCGENFCCASYKVWQYWYFWCGLVFFIILLTSCAGFWRYRVYGNRTIIVMQSSSGHNPYSRLSSKNTDACREVQSENYYTDYPARSQTNFANTTPHFPPPAYTEVGSHFEQKKQAYGD